MSVELDEFVEANQNLSKYTLRSYEHGYNKVYNVLNQKELSSISQKEIKDALQNKFGKIQPSSTKRQLLNSVIQVRRFKEKPVEMLLKYRDELQIKIDKKRLLDNELRYKDLPSYDDLYLHLKNLYCADLYRSYIINYILINLNTRNRDLDLILVDKKAEAKDKTKNYLIIRRNDTIVLRNVYKTSNIHGTKENKIRNTLFQRAVISFRDEERSRDYYNDPNDPNHGKVFLLAREDGGQLSEDSIAKYIRGFTLEKISESDINKIQVSHNSTNYNKLKQMSNNRGTSIDVLIDYYNIKVDKD